MVVVCLICDKIFSCQSSLNRHRKESHKLEASVVEYDKSICNYKCLEAGCKASFKCSGSLRLHLSKKHGIDGEEFEMSFSSFTDFSTWLSNEGKENNVQYSRSSGTKKTNDGLTKIIYFYCVRSGMQPAPLNNPKRFPKSQGSCKTNQFCTSQIIVNENSITGECNIRYYKRHYGHENEVQHLRILKVDREAVASKLMVGVPVPRILNTIRGNINDTLKRSDMMTRKDIYNIKTAFHINLNDGCRHADDATSVDLWISQCLESDNNPVIFYKKQGEVCREFNLSMQDFCLIIMDKSQSELLKKFGHTFIAIDSTHGLNAYDFELTTVLSVDEFRTGMPLAFMFSNRKDSYINEILFRKIKDILGPIKTDTFMSDITDVFYNPWTNIMGAARDQLYCSWHIDRAWQSNLSKINDSEKRDWVYKTLKYLQTLLDVQTFEEGLKDFLKILDDNSTLRFKEYFCNYYVPCVRKWAYCFRIGCIANTNMHLESMHKTLKYFYLEGKKIKRLDKTIHVLLEFLRNKKVERVIKLTKGCTSEHISNIHASHRVAITTKFKVEVIQVNMCFFIGSDSNKSKYLVTRDTTKTNVCCTIKCVICSICIHAYHCTCTDYCIRTIICKHIHYIVLNYPTTSSTEIPATKSNGEDGEVNGLVQANISIPVTKSNEELDNLVQDMSVKSNSSIQLKNEIRVRSLQLMENIESKEYSIEQLKMILQNVKNAESIGSIDHQHFNMEIKRVKEPANKQIAKQISFYSTRKRSTHKNHKRKPNVEETKVIKETLAQSVVLSNDARNDHCYDL